MKKTFFIIIAIALCASLSAQTKMPVKSQEGTAKYEVSLINDNQNAITTPQIRSSVLLSRGDGSLNAIGSTYYNLPTNNFARNTVSVKSDPPSAAVVWTTCGIENPSRGTGINYYDFTTNGWGPTLGPDVRIEQQRTGFGAHAYTENGEIVVAHNAITGPTGGIVVSTRDKAGEGEWSEYTLLGPEYKIASPNYNSPEVTTTGIEWPTLAANGNIVHLVAVTEQWGTLGQGMNMYPVGYSSGYMGFPTVPLYYRSHDGGKTWDIKAHDFRAEGMTDFEVEKTSGDNYSLFVKGDHVVLLYGYAFGFINYMESKDGGDSWEKKTVYEFDDFKDWNEGVVIPPRMAPSGGGAIFIDDNDHVHIAFGAQCRQRKETTPLGQYTYYANTGGLVYWNDSRSPITLEDMKGSFDTIDNTIYINYDWKKYPGYIGMPSVLGYENLNIWYYFAEPNNVGPSYNNTQFGNKGIAIFPRLIVNDGKVYLSYQSIVDYPLFYNGSTANYYRGIFLTVSMDNGETWDLANHTSWLSYYPDFFYCDWSDYHGPYYDDNHNPIPPKADEIKDFTPGENMFPTLNMNIYDNKLVIQWYSQYLPNTAANGLQNDPIDVYTFIKDLNEFPWYANIQSVYKGCYGIAEYGNRVLTPQIYPNPANNITNIKVDTNNPYTLTVTNMMGQVVYTQKCQQSKTDLNVSNFAPGIYIVNVRTAHAMGSQKLIVK